MTLSMYICWGLQTALWEAQINEIYGTTIECEVSRRPDAGNNTVGKIQGVYLVSDVEGSIFDWFMCPDATP